MIAWSLNLGFAASGAAAPPSPTGEVGRSGNYLLLWTGCWVAPLLAALLIGGR